MGQSLVGAEWDISGSVCPVDASRACRFLAVCLVSGAMCQCLVNILDHKAARLATVMGQALSQPTRIWAKPWASFCFL